MSRAVVAAPSHSYSREGLAVFANALRAVLGLDPLFEDGRSKRRNGDVERFFSPSYAWPEEVSQ